MIVSGKALRAFNNGTHPSANENYNRTHNIGSNVEHAILRGVQRAESGLFPKKVTQRQVQEWTACNAALCEGIVARWSSS